VGSGKGGRGRGGRGEGRSSRGRLGLYDSGVHLERQRRARARSPTIRTANRKNGRKTQYFNINAERREAQRSPAELAKQNAQRRGALHSLAFGTLKPTSGTIVLTERKMNRRTDTRSTSMAAFADGLLVRRGSSNTGLMGRGGRSFSKDVVRIQRVGETTERGCA